MISSFRKPYKSENARPSAARPVGGLSLADLSPRVARVLGEQVAALSAKQTVEGRDRLSEDEKKALAAVEQADRQNGMVRSGGGAAETLPPLNFTERYFLPFAYSSAVVAAYLGSYLHPAVMIVGFPVLLAMIAGLCIYLLPGSGGSVADVRTATLGTRAAAFVALRRVYPPDVLKNVTPLVVKGRTDAVFYDALLLLTDANTPLETNARRDVLRQINALIESRYDLDRHRVQIGSLLNDAALSTLESELRDLQRRSNDAARAGDAPAAESLVQSAELCAGRLESALALRALSARLDAQGEVIHQALAAIHFSLARLRAAPAALSAPNLADIRQTVARIESQTRAIEQAADEVRALRSSA